MIRHSACAGIIAVFLVCTAPAPSYADTPDQTAIQTVMHGMFDRPEAALVIAPVVVQDGFAVAGWTQGDMGGRAFLRKDGAQWTLVLCAGDGIRSVAGLMTSGVPAETAKMLAAAIAEAERSADPERQKQFASFQGTVRMDGH